MKTSLRRRDYHEYMWEKRELAVTVMVAILIVLFLAYFFYRSLWACLPLLGVGVLYVRMQRRRRCSQCRQELTIQFRECILSVSASLKAGYAVENAFLESRTDMELLYGRDSLIYRELELIRRGLVINITLEEQLFELAQRSDSPEIVQFARVFSIAKRNGGNMSEIIGMTAELIGQKLDAAREVETVLSGRRMEQTIMKIMPFGVLGYIGVSYPGYFDSLYHNWQGVAIMTVCLGIYLAAYVLGEKILQNILRELE